MHHFFPSVPRTFYLILGLFYTTNLTIPEMVFFVLPKNIKQIHSLKFISMFGFKLLFVTYLNSDDEGQIIINNKHALSVFSAFASH
jgi:hypothetical protein